MGSEMCIRDSAKAAQIVSWIAIGLSLLVILFYGVAIAIAIGSEA